MAHIAHAAIRARAARFDLQGSTMCVRKVWSSAHLCTLTSGPPRAWGVCEDLAKVEVSQRATERESRVRPFSSNLSTARAEEPTEMREDLPRAAALSASRQCFNGLFRNARPPDLTAIALAYRRPSTLKSQVYSASTGTHGVTEQYFIQLFRFRLFRQHCVSHPFGSYTKFC